MSLLHSARTQGSADPHLLTVFLCPQMDPDCCGLSIVTPAAPRPAADLPPAVLHGADGSRGPPADRTWPAYEEEKGGLMMLTIDIYVCIT